MVNKEVCSERADSTLAEVINDAFMNNMDDEQHSQMIEDNNIARPENCDSWSQSNVTLWYGVCAQLVKNLLMKSFKTR